MPKRERKKKLRSLPQTNSAATSPGRMVIISWGPGSLRRGKGPVPGTLARYKEDDRKLYTELERLMDEKHMSPTAAARQLAEQNRVAGIGTSESRARRLATLYRAERR
jgi:hypothetical protein